MFLLNVCVVSVVCRHYYHCCIVFVRILTVCNMPFIIILRIHRQQSIMSHLNEKPPKKERVCEEVIPLLWPLDLSPPPFQWPPRHYHPMVHPLAPWLLRLMQSFIWIAIQADPSMKQTQTKALAWRRALQTTMRDIRINVLEGYATDA